MVTPKSREKRTQQAIQLVQDGKTYRFDSEVTKIPRSTISSRITSQRLSSQRSKTIRSRLDSLTTTEEELVVTLLIRYAERGMPLRRPVLKEAIAIVVSRMLPVRRRILKFKNSKPGDRYLRDFVGRHSEKIKFFKPLRQEGSDFKHATPGY